VQRKSLFGELCLLVADAASIFSAQQKGARQDGKRRPILRLHNCPHFQFTSSSPAHTCREKSRNDLLCAGNHYCCWFGVWYLWIDPAGCPFSNGNGESTAK